MNLTLVLYACVSFYISCISLTLSIHSWPLSSFVATSSTGLEDLSYLDNQRAAGHRSSVRKHNTAGRTSDDSKGIRKLSLREKSVCKYSLVRKDLQICVAHARPQCHCVNDPFLYGSDSFSPSVQGDWCHSSKPTSCLNRCCLKSPASPQRHLLSAVIGSSRVWRRSLVKQAAARGAVLSSWGTQDPARLLSSGGCWHSAVRACARHREVPASLTAPVPPLNVRLLSLFGAA